MSRKKARVTLAEIAAAAGVSVTTVSNVANGRLEMMSAATRERVEAVMRRLNYRPNEGARGLRLAQRRAIGLLMIDESPRFLADPMNTNIVAGLSNHLSVHGYVLLMAGISPGAVDQTPLIRRDQTDALCVIPSGSIAERRQLYQRLADADQPVLVFQDEVPPSLADALSLRQDDRRAGMLIAERVIARGARHLALLTPSQRWPAMAERQAGIKAVVDASGENIRFDIVVSGSEGLADTRTAITRYVDRGTLPDAFLGGNDQMAIAAIMWALDRHLSVPGDVKVTGFNAFDFAEYIRPRLTTVRSPAYEMGKQGAALLLDRLAEGRFTHRDVLLDVALQPGESD